MSGFSDIDGSNIMAGSPDLVLCAGIEIQHAVNERSAVGRILALDPGTTEHTAAAQAIVRDVQSVVMLAARQLAGSTSSDAAADRSRWAAVVRAMKEAR